MDQRKPRILYGEANFQAIIQGNGYYVDKTPFIAKLERFRSPVFLRPRRFGKSLLCTTLQYYYDVNHKHEFQKLFGDTWIGAHPTSEQGSYFVIHFDFSVIDPSGSIEEIQQQFSDSLNIKLRAFLTLNREVFPENTTIDPHKSGAYNFTAITNLAHALGLPKFFVIIDEYDNFANQLIIDRKDQHYRELTGDDGILKAFFKTLKELRKNQIVARVFITGVLPITIDDLSSGYNIADFLTLDPEFDTMLGFTQDEVTTLLNRIFEDYDLDPNLRQQVVEVIKSNYNGYRFNVGQKEALYNSTILMYFLEKLTRFGQIPEFLTDLNLKTDIRWIRRLTAYNPERMQELVDQLTIQNQLTYSKSQLRDKFDMTQFFEKSFYPISMFYLGMLTRRDDFTMQIPNLNMKAIVSEYFHEIHHVDVATRYADMMRGFIQNPDLPRLFADWWRIYVSQLPEAVFAKVNENFYRTTFYDICRQFLSNYFVWRMEHSYPSGRSDLEMEGKFHTPFAGTLFLMEFKYLSNAQSANRNLDEFTAESGDLGQLDVYLQDRRTQYPEQRVDAFLIYCFGNRGFRIFSP